MHSTVHSSIHNLIIPLPLSFLSLSSRSMATHNTLEERERKREMLVGVTRVISLIDETRDVATFSHRFSRFSLVEQTMNRGQSFYLQYSSRPVPFLVWQLPFSSFSCNPHSWECAWIRPYFTLSDIFFIYEKRKRRRVVFTRWMSMNKQEK